MTHSTKETSRLQLMLRAAWGFCQVFPSELRRFIPIQSRDLSLGIPSGIQTKPLFLNLSFWRSFILCS